MPTAWRIVAEKYAATAFDGEGARLHGGRWSSPGIAMVYTSDSPSLAALELLVGLNDASFLSRFVLRGIEVPDASVADLDRSLLPPDWRAYPAPPRLARLGDSWIRAKSSLALRVPSAVIEQQWNLLLDPTHPDFASLSTGPAIAFELDQRLVPRP